MNIKLPGYPCRACKEQFLDCRCPLDPNTQDVMACPHCFKPWWRPSGADTTLCPHPGCRRVGSTVSSPAFYAPTRDAYCPPPPVEPVL